MMRASYLRLAAALAALLMAASMPAIAASATDHAGRITALIGQTYDRPDHKVETAPVVVVGGYALADWIQGDNGGRALLRQHHGEWEIVACGGDGFKDPAQLQLAGIPAATAMQLVAKLNQAERTLNPKRVKQFGLFGSAVDPRMHGEHHPSH